MTSHRVSNAGLIDRSRALGFTFDGTSYTGFEGDTLASALLANGVRVVGRSFKYHRPRGVWGAWFDDPNAIFNVTLNNRELPNCPATTTPLADGMSARSVNAFPSALFDIKGGLDLFHRWLSAGFYYKTFMWPDWHLFEPMIRKMAGLGTLNPELLDNFTSDQVHEACDVLVIGGGAAGLVAARAAAESGQNAVLVDDHPEMGGGLYAAGSIDGTAPKDWVAAQIAAIQTAGGRILASTTAFGVFDHRLVGLVQNNGFGAAPRLIRMRAGRMIMATGALDRPITFANNDRPGVMSLTGASEFLARYGVLAGREIAVLSNNNFAEPIIGQLEAAGARVLVLDPTLGEMRAVGRKLLKGVEVAGQFHAVDSVLVSGGLTPIVHLWRHAGGNLIGPTPSRPSSPVRHRTECSQLARPMAHLI
ncbi:2Fe-2S iron-sulfur cluster-binding protein [Rhodophyticola sp. CCM32]|uniref:2Fe-2S iron-sulfur cluster-binding protein n=1 Tax=Rhodophyticola sp. CCM32 TaxID=2916397 RepID=UPI001AEF9696|nr:2Fe-2S iron-sulfur cluster-binding protein [Rhodophyticola sp. CCM32]